MKVLIVDDSRGMRMMIRRAIRQAGFGNLTFEDAANGQEGLEKYDSFAPDIILSDWNMPVMDGFQFMEEFAELLPSLKKSIKVYMVSSSMDPKDIKKAKRFEEISDYLIKPLNSKDIKEIIAKL